jgi:hypothetical protein
MISVTGRGFAPAPVVSLSGAGATVGAVSYVSEHELSLSITVASDAPTGARSVTVRNSGTGPGLSAGDSGTCGNCLSVN